MSNSELIIFGTGEIATLARYYFENDSDYRVVAFTADDENVEGDTFEGLPLVPFSKIGETHDPGAFVMHVALSYRGLNANRQSAYERAKHAGYTLVSYVCSKSVTWPDLKHGDNCFILENQTIQPTVTIGNNVMIWSGNHLGHGCSIADHAYVASHVVLSGHSRVGERSFIGVNATVKDFTSIGDDCFVGMGATVAKDVENGSVVIAESGTVLPADDRRASVLKRKFFG